MAGLIPSGGPAAPRASGRRYWHVQKQHIKMKAQPKKEKIHFFLPSSLAPGPGRRPGAPAAATAKFSLKQLSAHDGGCTTAAPASATPPPLVVVGAGKNSLPTNATRMRHMNGFES